MDESFYRDQGLLSCTGLLFILSDVSSVQVLACFQTGFPFLFMFVKLLAEKSIQDINHIYETLRNWYGMESPKPKVFNLSPFLSLFFILHSHYYSMLHYCFLNQIIQYDYTHKYLDLDTVIIILPLYIMTMDLK